MYFKFVPKLKPEIPKTLSQPLNLETLSPTVTTTPENTVPNMGFPGFEILKAECIITLENELTSTLLTQTSPEFTAVTTTLINI